MGILAYLTTYLSGSHTVFVRQREFTLVMLTIILVVLGVLAFLIFSYTQSTSRNVPANSTNTDIQKAQTEWKTFTNSRQNYQFNYPPTWTVSENTQIRQTDNQRQDIVTVDVDGVTPRVEIDSNIVLKLSINDLNQKPKSNIKIAGLDTFLETQEDEGGGEFKTYYFIRNKKIYSLTTINYTQNNAEGYENPEEVFNEVINSFKFIK